MKLLLVDDDAFLRDMYSIKFAEYGYDVDAADGAPAVLSRFQQGNTYDLVLMDMIMPGTQGVELLRMIKEQYNDKFKYCIFLSNQGQDEDIDEATEAGAIGYIIKASCIPSEVVKKVEKILEKVHKTT